MESFLYDSALFFHSLYHLYSQALVVIALVALLNYLVIFQLLGLYSALIINLDPPFPDEKGAVKGRVEQNDSAGHGDDNGDRRRNWPGLYFR